MVNTKKYRLSEKEYKEMLTPIIKARTKQRIFGLIFILVWLILVISGLFINNAVLLILAFIANFIFVWYVGYTGGYRAGLLDDAEASEKIFNKYANNVVRLVEDAAEEAEKKAKKKGKK